MAPAFEPGGMPAPAADGRGAASRRMECRICWTVYDPALGDAVWRIPPGTPFSALPPHWTCPTCAAQQHDFLVVDD